MSNFDQTTTIPQVLFFFMLSFFILESCNRPDSSNSKIKTEAQIVKIIDAVPLNQPDLYIKTIKDSAKNEAEIQGMCYYLLSSGWKQTPDAYTALLHKMDSAYGKSNDTIHCNILNYSCQNLLRIQQKDSAAKVIQLCLSLAERLNDSTLLSTTYQTLSMSYVMNTKFVKAISAIQKSMDYLSSKNVVNLCDLKADLSQIYGTQRNHKKAKEVMYESFMLARKYRDSTVVALYATHLANTYLDLKMGDSTLWAAEQSLQIANKMQDSSLFGLIYFYMGAAYNLKKEPQKGIEYSLKSIKICEMQQNVWLKMRANTTIANCYLTMGELEKAKSLYKAIEQEQQEKMGIKINTAICDSLVVLALEQAGEKPLRNYFSFVHHFVDSTFSAQEISILEEMNVRYETEKKENEIKKLALEKKSAQLQTLIAALILLLVLGIAAWIIYRNRQQRLLLEKEKTILESSKQLLEINKKLQTQEIEEHKKELVNFNEKILAKNALIEEMQAQMTELLKNASSMPNEDIIKNATTLNAMKILTEGDWEMYLRYFENAKPHLITRITTAFPTLTQGELRLFLLMNLGFSRQQIADILGISWEGARKNQYRLKKKLDLSDEKTLEDFILKFS
jgi:hypothetical protein